MKLLKYLIAIVIALAIVASVLNFKRETIARNIANSALRDKGLVATDLSIDTLGTEYIVLSRLTLEQDSGTRYELRGITFPLSFPSPKAETITIDELRMVPAVNDGEPIDVAAILGVVLQLPQSIPNTTVLLGRFSADELPTLRDIEWQSSGDNQQALFSLDAIDVQAELVRDGLDGHRAALNIATGNDPDALNLPLTIARREAGYTVEGNASIHLLPWLPLLHAAELAPDKLTVLDATLDGPVTIEIADDDAQAITFGGQLGVAGVREARFEYAEDAAITLQLSEGSTLDLGVTYPALEWRAAIAQADFRLNSSLAEKVPGRLTNLACRNGVECTMRLGFSQVPLELGTAGSAIADIASTVVLGIGEVTKIEFLPETVVTLTNLNSGSASVASLSVSGVTDAHLIIAGERWDATAEQLHLDFQSLAVAAAEVPTLPIAIRSLRLQDGGSSLNFQYSVAPGTASILWHGEGIVAPGVSGAFSRVGDDLSTTLDLNDDLNALSAQVALKHEMDSGAGTATIRNAALAFDRRNLSGWRRNWPYGWDVVAGNWAAEADFAWDSNDGDFNLSASTSQSVDSIAGHYNNIAFTGLAASLAATMAPDGTVVVTPTTISVALLDVGIPVEELSAVIEPDFSNEQIAVQGLSMSVLGGKIVADPFVYAPQEPSNNIMLRPQLIQLQFMVNLAEFDDIELSGSISGRVPVNISDKAITVTGGRLESDAPGGVIRYRAGAAADAMGNNEINLVSRALGNFQFDSLTSDVDYTEDGDLKLKMRLSGINPDMDPRQPVILNLGVENNIPQLLRSLQATRAIEDVLQQKGRN